VRCPEDCVFLTGAHAGGWGGRETEQRRDLRRLGPHLHSLTEEQAELLMRTLLSVVDLRGEFPDLDDLLLADAASAYGKTLATRERGVLYEHQPSDLRAQAVMRGLRDRIESGRPSDRDLLAAIRALEGSIQDTLKEAGGGAAFVETAARLVTRFQASSPPPRPPSLIVGP